MFFALELPFAHLLRSILSAKYQSPLKFCATDIFIQPFNYIRYMSACQSVFSALRIFSLSTLRIFSAFSAFFNLTHFS
jgi:hypothetical protein